MKFMMGLQAEQGVTIILYTATDVLLNSPLSVDFIRRFPACPKITLFVTNYVLCEAQFDSHPQ